MNDFLLSIVIPCYNEAENLPLLIERIGNALLQYRYEIILVNDGSTDNTQEVIEILSLRKAEVKYLSFSRNFGNQKAIKAGIDHSKGDCIVTMDADMQHPPNIIPEMIGLWQNGYDLITAVSKYSEQPLWLKRFTSRIFGWLWDKMSDQTVISNCSDFKLFDKKIANTLRQMSEQNLFLRSIFTWIGFKQTTVEFKEGKRVYGNTKFTFKKLLQLASNGIISRSIKPLRLAFFIGILLLLGSFGYGIYVIVLLLTGNLVLKWGLVVAFIAFLSGVQLIVLGIIGEYIGKISIESRERPTYIIDKTNVHNTNKMIIVKKERRTAMK